MKRTLLALMAVLLLAQMLWAQMDHTVTGNYSSGTTIIAASGNITTSGSVQITASASVVVRAGQQVMLLDGFRAGEGFTTGAQLYVLAGATPPDTDGDGIPDYWEIIYGLNPNSTSDRDSDPDSDGVTNYQEFLAGTNPKVAPTAGGTTLRVHRP